MAVRVHILCLLCNRERSPGCFVFRVIEGAAALALAHDQRGALINKTHQKGHSLQILNFCLPFKKWVWILSVFHFFLNVSRPRMEWCPSSPQDHPAAD